MSPTIEQLLDAALALPDEERLEFAEALVSSLQPTDRPLFDESWREIVRRRSAELRSDEVTPVPWSEVKQRAGKSLQPSNSGGRRNSAEILAEIAALPLEPGGQEFSGRDHDQILYGK